MSTFVHQSSIRNSTLSSSSSQTPSMVYDTKKPLVSSLALGKLSKDAINRMRNQSDRDANSIKPAPSEVILKHCKELLDNHSLRKPSVWSQEPLLSTDDVKLLRHIIESNERYRCLKEEDSSLLKEILVTQMSEVQSQQQFLWRFLKILQDKRKNVAKKRFIDMGSQKIPTKVQSESHVPKKKLASGRKCFTDRSSREFSSFSCGEKKAPLCKLKIEGYVSRKELVQYMPISWRITSYQYKCKQFEIKCLIIENLEKFCHPNSRVSQWCCSELVESNDEYTRFFNIIIPGKVPRNLLDKLLKTVCKLNTDPEKPKTVPAESSKCCRLYSVLKAVNIFRRKVRVHSGISRFSGQMEISNNKQELKNWIVFLVDLLLISILVLSLTAVDFRCLD